MEPKNGSAMASRNMPTNEIRDRGRAITTYTPHPPATSPPPGPGYTASDGPRRRYIAPRDDTVVPWDQPGLNNESLSHRPWDETISNNKPPANAESVSNDAPISRPRTRFFIKSGSIANFASRSKSRIARSFSKSNATDAYGQIHDPSEYSSQIPRPIPVPQATSNFGNARTPTSIPCPAGAPLAGSFKKRVPRVSSVPSVPDVADVADVVNVPEVLNLAPVPYFPVSDFMKPAWWSGRISSMGDRFLACHAKAALEKLSEEEVRVTKAKWIFQKLEAQCLTSAARASLKECKVAYAYNNRIENHLISQRTRQNLTSIYPFAQNSKSITNGVSVTPTDNDKRKSWYSILSGQDDELESTSAENSTAALATPGSVAVAGGSWATRLKRKVSSFGLNF